MHNSREPGCAGRIRFAHCSLKFVASCHQPGAENFEVAARLLEHFSTRIYLFTYALKRQCPRI
jgi:hypothetical protein